MVGSKVADDVPATVLEGRIVPIGPHGPAEDGFVEGGRRLRVGSWDPEVRDPADPEHWMLALRARHGGIIDAHEWPRISTLLTDRRACTFARSTRRGRRSFSGTGPVAASSRRTSSGRRAPRARP